MNQELFLNSLPELQKAVLDPNTALEKAIHQASIENQWFTPDFIRLALTSIGNSSMDRGKCRSWLSQYPVTTTNPKNIGIIMAGNIPLVGFHDLFCVLASGNRATVKLSDKDAVLIKEVVSQWNEILPGINEHVQFTERLVDFDAVIATGSNNSSRYFEYYFSKYPHLLRRNRNGIAILTGDETIDDLKRLADDIFLYFGLGCRNVSFMMVPDGYNFTLWEEAIEKYQELQHHNKYKNNLEYNFAIYIINQIPHIYYPQLILKEDPVIA
ncbi:MAG: acyl-CoA reductase, partial [Bacteroidota bacterium]|nr:acyl-CoA reductase [Bacteroidota bacterium]